MGDIIKTAQCRFCGQMVQIETDKELTQPQAEEQATLEYTGELNEKALSSRYMMHSFRSVIRERFSCKDCG